jgi:ribosomal protein S7
LQEGKKATAQKIVLEAMEIIRSELAQSAASAAAETAARNAKVAEASEKAAVSGKRLRKEATGNAVSS